MIFLCECLHAIMWIFTGEIWFSLLCFTAGEKVAPKLNVRPKKVYRRNYFFYNIGYLNFCALLNCGNLLLFLKLTPKVCCTCYLVLLHHDNRFNANFQCSKDDEHLKFTVVSYVCNTELPPFLMRQEMCFTIKVPAAVWCEWTYVLLHWSVC